MFQQKKYVCFCLKNRIKGKIPKIDTIAGTKLPFGGPIVGEWAYSFLHDFLGGENILEIFSGKAKKRTEQKRIKLFFGLNYQNFE